jgi:hypothetical protein
VVSPGDWLVSSIWFFLSTRLVSTGRQNEFDSSYRVGRAVVFTRQQLHCPSVSSLFGQLLCQQGGAIQFWMLPLSHEITSGTHHLLHFGRVACCPTLLDASLPPLGVWFVTPAFVAWPVFFHWEFSTESSSSSFSPMLQGRFSVPLHLHCWC